MRALAMAMGIGMAVALGVGFVAGKLHGAGGEPACDEIVDGYRNTPGSKASAMGEEAWSGPRGLRDWYMRFCEGNPREFVMRHLEHSLGDGVWRPAPRVAP